MTIALDVVLAGYLVLAFTAFNKPDETAKVCTKVSIDIQDETTNGFISAEEIKNRLTRVRLYPLGKPMSSIDARSIEETLKISPFVQTAECYKTQDGHICITITQRMPIVRIKANNGDDYYIDDNDHIMPNSHYTSDMIIATGHINKWFAQNYIYFLSKALMGNDLWKNLVEQINVLQDKSIELVPRIGNHIVCLGPLPESKYRSEREQMINAFTQKKMDRLEKFYKYGLSKAGWNKYSYIDLEFDNQIICTKSEECMAEEEKVEAANAVSEEGQATGDGLQKSQKEQPTGQVESSTAENVTSQKAAETRQEKSNDPSTKEGTTKDKGSKTKKKDAKAGKGNASQGGQADAKKAGSAKDNKKKK